MTLIEKAKLMLLGRQRSYRVVFDQSKREAQHVLYDLERFCRGTKSCFHQDPRAHAVLEGRREVFLRIQEYLNLSPEEVWEIKRRKDLEDVGNSSNS